MFYTGSEHTILITIKNPTEWDWVYSVYWYGAHDPELGDYGFVSEDNSIAAGQSKTMVGSTRMNPVPGTYPSTVLVMEMNTGTTFDLFSFEDIVLEEEIVPVPAIEVSIVWDNSSKVFNRYTTQWSTVTLRNPTAETWTYNVFILSSAFAGGLGPLYEETLGPGQSATARWGPFVNGEPGSHVVYVTVVEVSTGITIKDSEYLDTITIAQPVPAVEVILSWD